MNHKMKIMTKEEAIQILSTRDAHGVLCGYTSGVTEALDMAVEALKDRPMGEWVDKGGYSECSECGEVAQNVELCDCVYERLTNYCPNCGAMMRRKDSKV